MSILPFIISSSLFFSGDPILQKELSTGSNVPAKHVYTRDGTQRIQGISINVYRVARAGSINELKNIDEQIRMAEDSKVDLYKMTEDLAIIFTNSIDPFNNSKTIPYLMLFGEPTQKMVEVGDVGGFLPSSRVAQVTKWIKENNINNYAGFEKLYNGLSAEVKQQLKAMESPSPPEMFNAYVKPLCVLYFTALQDNNSILFVGE